MEVRAKAAVLAVAVLLGPVPVSVAQAGPACRAPADPVGPLPVCGRPRQDGAGVDRDDERTCLEGVGLCVVHDLGPGASVGLDPDAACPGRDPAVRVATPPANLSLCVGARPGDPPRIGAEPPDAGDLGSSFVGTCADGTGATAIVAGTGATVCVRVAASTDGETFDVDLTPCPSGADPSVDLAGVHVEICVVAQIHGGGSDLPDPSAGDVDLPYPYRFVPELRLGGCGPGTGGEVEVGDAVGSACLAVTDVTAPALRTCDGGTGATVGWDDARAGACA